MPPIKKDGKQDLRTSRMLIIDDSPAIHGDIKKVLAVKQVNTELDDVASLLFGDEAPTSTEPASVVKFDIDSAFQGRDGLALVEQAIREGRPYEVAFVDVRMPPGWNGITTISRIWAIDPYLQIILCTAYSDHTWDQIVDQLGGNDGLLILKKPFDSIEVQQTAHALIRKWHLSRELSTHVDDLEHAVAKRTKELQEINDRLQEEIAERRKLEEKFKYLASHDDVTGLPNRIMLRDRAGHALARARRYNRYIVFMMLDLDKFKDVNDTHGHDVGDSVLKAAAKRLSDAVRECDTVARLGGDEFMILLDDIDDPANAVLVAKRILERFKNPVAVEGKMLEVMVSIGISAFPGDAAEFESLMKSADTAMYSAKRAGRGTYRFFSEDLRLRAVKDSEVRESLAEAINREELVLHYQPLVSVTTGSITGIEALVRWNHSERGLLTPVEFLGTAEESGLIVPLGEWVLRTACAQNKAWQDMGLPSVPVTVNLSAKQFHEHGLTDKIMQILEETGLDADYLQLEVTESTVLADLEYFSQVIVRLHDLGVKILLDDFGSGYASLNKLRNLPIHGLKIDSLFTQKIVEDQCDAAFVTAIIALSHSLNFEVIAEGVETIQQLEQLRGMQWNLATEMVCDKAQGRYFSPPMPAEELERKMRELWHGTPDRAQVELSVDESKA